MQDGVLRDVCDTYSRTDRDFSSHFWDEHGFKAEQEDYGYELFTRFELYQSGLEVLGEINSDAGFLAPILEI